MALADTYGSVTPGQATATLLAAFEAGVTFFDTADVYGNGANERLVGQVLGPLRNEVTIATKGGATRDKDGKPTNDGSPDYLRQACEASLKRLGVDTIDLYYLHRADPGVPIEESVGALVRLKEAGKIKAIGLSEVKAQTLRSAHKIHPIAALQTEYSLACRFPEEELFSACDELGVSFVAYSPLGRGLLAGALPGGGPLPEGDIRRNIPRFQGDNLKINLGLSRRLAQLASEYGFEPSELALAWILSRPNKPFVIPGTRKPERAGINARAAEVSLPAGLASELEVIFANDAIQGERHTAHMLSRTGL